jgi:hypothetical protein
MIAGLVWLGRINWRQHTMNQSTTTEDQPRA